MQEYGKLEHILSCILRSRDRMVQDIHMIIFHFKFISSDILRNQVSLWLDRRDVRGMPNFARMSERLLQETLRLHLQARMVRTALSNS